MEGLDANNFTGLVAQLAGHEVRRRLNAISNPNVCIEDLDANGMDQIIASITSIGSLTTDVIQQIVSDLCEIPEITAAKVVEIVDKASCLFNVGADDLAGQQFAAISTIVTNWGGVY